MPNTIATGVHWSGDNPNWQRDYYSLLLMETLRTKSILVPFCHYYEDFQAAKSGVIVETEVYDTEPNWNGLSEDDIWLRGAHLDTRTLRMELEIHGDTLKYSDHSKVVQYVNNGDMDGLVKNKIGQNQVDYLDILARNALFAHPYKNYGGSKTARADLLAADKFLPNLARLARLHLEEDEVPGVADPFGGGQAIVAITTPRVIYDIQTEVQSDWKDAQLYEQTGRIFTGEVGMWGGVRFVKTNRMRLRNAGAVTHETTIDANIAPGDGAAATVDGVYSPGQSTSTRTIAVGDASGFSVGDYVTVHDQGNVADTGVPEGDGTQETRRIVSANLNDLEFNKPFLKPHTAGDYVTLGLDVHGTAVMGGPGVAYGVGERPRVIKPPKIDDLQMINRLGWRGFLKMQLYRPEFIEVIETAGSTD